jgi:hypothetical protein
LSAHPITFRVDLVAPIRRERRGRDHFRATTNRGKRMRGKPNYRFGRAERDRAKQAKREEKLKSRQERAALQQPEVPPPPDDDEPSPGSPLPEKP